MSTTLMDIAVCRSLEQPVGPTKYCETSTLRTNESRQLPPISARWTT